MIAATLPLPLMMTTTIHPRNQSPRTATAIAVNAPRLRTAAAKRAPTHARRPVAAVAAAAPAVADVTGARTARTGRRTPLPPGPTRSPHVAQLPDRQTGCMDRATAPGPSDTPLSFTCCHDAGRYILVPVIGYMRTDGVLLLVAVVACVVGLPYAAYRMRHRVTRQRLYKIAAAAIGVLAVLIMVGVIVYPVAIDPLLKQIPDAIPDDNSVAMHHWYTIRRSKHESDRKRHAAGLPVIDLTPFERPRKILLMNETEVRAVYEIVLAAAHDRWIVLSHRCGTARQQAAAVVVTAAILVGPLTVRALTRNQGRCRVSSTVPTGTTSTTWAWRHARRRVCAPRAVATRPSMGSTRGRSIAARSATAGSYRTIARSCRQSSAGSTSGCAHRLSGKPATRQCTWATEAGYRDL